MVGKFSHNIVLHSKGRYAKAIVHIVNSKLENNAPQMLLQDMEQVIFPADLAGSIDSVKRPTWSKTILPLDYVTQLHHEYKLQLRYEKSPIEQEFSVGKISPTSVAIQ